MFIEFAPLLYYAADFGTSVFSQLYSLNHAIFLPIFDFQYVCSPNQPTLTAARTVGKHEDSAAAV